MCINCVKNASAKQESCEQAVKSFIEAAKENIGDGTTFIGLISRADEVKNGGEDDVQMRIAASAFGDSVLLTEMLQSALSKDARLRGVAFVAICRLVTDNETMAGELAYVFEMADKSRHMSEGDKIIKSVFDKPQTND